MVTAEERMQIIQMVADGKISAEEGTRLLEALAKGSRPSTSAEAKPRWFKVRVTDLATGKERINMRFPLGLVQVGVKMGARFTPEMEGVNFDEIVAAIKGGAHGQIVDLTDEQGGERVEIYLE